MSYNEHLYLLIQSLNPSEKRYFTLHAKQFSNDVKSNALQLFEAINKFKVLNYDEKEFLKLHKRKSFCKNFTYEKSYLIELILKVMRSFHSEKRVDYKIYESHLDIQFLIDRGLTDQAIKLISKSSQLAKENNMHAELLKTFQFEHNLISDGLIIKETESYFKEMNDTLNSISLELNWYRQQMEMKQLLQEPNFVHNLDEIKNRVSKIKEQLSRNELPNAIRMIALNILQFYYQKVHDLDNILIISKNILDEYEDENNGKEYRARVHLILISNVLFSILNIERLDEMTFYLNKLKQVKVEAELDKVNQFRIYTYYLLLYKINTQDFSDVDSITNEVDSGIKKYHYQLSERVVIRFQFNLIILFFLSKHYDKIQERLILFYKLYKNTADSKYLMSILGCIEIMVLTHMGAASTAQSLIRSWSRSHAEIAKEEKVFKCIETILRDIDKPNMKFELKLAELENCACHLKWEQLKGLVLDWARYYRTK